MTAKQLLHAYIDSLPEDDAAIAAAVWLPSRKSLTAEDRRLLDRALAEADKGELVSLEEVELEFGIRSPH